MKYAPGLRWGFLMRCISPLSTLTNMDYTEEIKELLAWFALVDWWKSRKLSR